MRKLQLTDLWSGVFLLLVALFFYAFGGDYAVGTVAEMGPGFIPRLLSVALAVIGLAVAGRALVEGGEIITDKVWSIRPMLTVIAGIVLFALTARSLGYLIASALLLVVTGLASDEHRLREVLILAAVLSVLSGLVFILAIGIPLPMFPAW